MSANKRNFDLNQKLYARDDKYQITRRRWLSAVTRINRKELLNGCPGTSVPGRRQADYSLSSACSSVSQAEATAINNLSAHAGADEIMDWLKGLRTPPRRTFMAHGEPAAVDALRHSIEERLGWSPAVFRITSRKPSLLDWVAHNATTRLENRLYIAGDAVGA